MYLWERKVFAKSFSGWSTDRNIIKISCHSRLFLVLQLLVNWIIIMTIARKVVGHVFILIQFFSYLRKQGWFFSLGALKRIHPWGAFEWVIWLLCSLELSESHRFSDGFREGAELNRFAWTCFVWFLCSGGVPLVLRRYSVDILGCSAGVPVNVKLFRHCSGEFRCSAGVPCAGVPGFIVCHKKCMWKFADLHYYDAEKRKKNELSLTSFQIGKC